jgi:hypothetical protein
VSPDRLIAATVAAMPLIMPYYMDYDLLLLAVPAMLFAADVRRSGSPMTRLDCWTTAAWALLFVCLFVNPFVAFDTRVSLTVPLLAGLDGLLIVWAGKAAVLGPQQTCSRADTDSIVLCPADDIEDANERFTAMVYPKASRQSLV